MAENFWTDNPDLRFCFDQIDWKELVELVEEPFDDEDAPKTAEEALGFYRDMLESMGEFIAAEIAPHGREFDEQHPTLGDDGEVTDPPRMAAVMKKLAEMGAMGLTLPRRLGGMNAPNVVGAVLMEMMARAEVSVMSHFGFHSGIANALMMYSLEEGSIEIEDGLVTKTRFDEAIEQTAIGKDWGAMVLTEPGAGSDLAQIRTKAVQQDDGSWRLNGQKIFITSGHGEHHIVIARTEDSETHTGLKGLSLFYVPAHVERDGKRVRNFEIGGLEHKMGQHSVVAATLHYEDSYGELLGRRGHGFLGMLLLMNNARIAVGFEGLGLMEAAYRQASHYADERVSMGKPIAQHEMIADYLDEMDLGIRGLRAITMEAAFHEEISARLKISRKLRSDDDDTRRERDRRMRRHKRKARRLTPLIKYFAGEESVRFARMDMQILGGLGYIVETGAEKLLRDALVVPVYEGTSQIQALMALKDTMQGVLRNPGRFFSELASSRIDSMRGENLDRGLARLQAIQSSAIQTILTNIAADKLGDIKGKPLLQWKSAFSKDWDPGKDFSFGMLHAERLTQILTWTAMAEALVAQAKKAEGDAAEQRAAIAERFISRFEPRAKGVLGEIEVTGSIRRRIFGRHKPERSGSDSSAENAG